MVTRVVHGNVRSEQQAKTPETVRGEAALSSEMTCGCGHLPPAPHRLEQEVRRSLLANPHVCISSLVVRRLPNGVCIEGVLETDDGPPDVCALVRCIPGISEVVNHLVVRHPSPKG